MVGPRGLMIVGPKRLTMVGPSRLTWSVPRWLTIVGAKGAIGASSYARFLFADGCRLEEASCEPQTMLSSSSVAAIESSLSHRELFMASHSLTPPAEIQEHQVARRQGLLARIDALESQIRETCDEMRAEFWEMRLRVDSLERRMWLHAQGMKGLLNEGSDELLRLMVTHEEIIARLDQLREECDAEDADSDQ